MATALEFILETTSYRFPFLLDNKVNLIKLHSSLKCRFSRSSSRKKKEPKNSLESEKFNAQFILAHDSEKTSQAHTQCVSLVVQGAAAAKNFPEEKLNA